MSAKSANDTADQAARVLDDLAALSIDLSCHCNVPPHTLVLSAGKIREACETIDDAVASLKRILTIASANGSGPQPPTLP